MHASILQLYEYTIGTAWPGLVLTCLASSTANTLSPFGLPSASFSKNTELYPFSPSPDTCATQQTQQKDRQPQSQRRKNSTIVFGVTKQTPREQPARAQTTLRNAGKNPPAETPFQRGVPARPQWAFREQPTQRDKYTHGQELSAGTQEANFMTEVERAASKAPLAAGSPAYPRIQHSAHKKKNTLGC